MYRGDCTVSKLTVTFVYIIRRDEIDSSHYPIFHQMEGVKMFSPEDFDPSATREEQLRIVEEDLKRSLEGMAKALFGDVVGISR